MTRIKSIRLAPLQSRGREKGKVYGLESSRYGEPGLSEKQQHGVFCIVVRVKMICTRSWYLSPLCADIAYMYPQSCVLCLLQQTDLVVKFIFDRFTKATLSVTFQNANGTFSYQLANDRVTRCPYGSTILTSCKREMTVDLRPSEFHLVIPPYAMTHVRFGGDVAPVLARKSVLCLSGGLLPQCHTYPSWLCFRYI